MINPYGGSKRARDVWTDIVEPIFRLAGVMFYSFETQHEVCELALPPGVVRRCIYHVSARLLLVCWYLSGELLGEY